MDSMEVDAINSNEQAGEEIGKLLVDRLRQSDELADVPSALVEWMQTHPEPQQVFNDLTQGDQLFEDLADYEEVGNRTEAALGKFRELRAAKASNLDTTTGRGSRRVIFYLVGIAASLLMVITGYFYIPWRHPDRTPNLSSAVAQNDVPPGGNHAILQLAGGRQVVLDSAQNGQLAQQGATVVEKRKDGEVIYRPAGGSTDQVFMNALMTRRGDQFKIVLPDGTLAFLNSATTLRYPTAFNGAVREVELDGEAYFEVASNKDKPFIVHSNRATVQVMGTRFNLQDYIDEPVDLTTLVDGAVRVDLVRGAQAPPSGDPVKHSVVLKPGEQAVVAGSDQLRLNRSADLAEALAWTKGRFVFQDTRLGVAMREIERWYDVKVEFAPGTDSNRMIIGGASRQENLSELIKLLKMTGTNCRMEGRKVTVEP